MATPLRLGILVSHPIQYYSPWFRFLANRLDLEVFYAHRQDAGGQAEAGFGVAFEWDTPVLEGYPYRWLHNVARSPGVGSFGGCDTPEMYRILARERFDAFLVIGWNHKSAIQAILACRQNGVPVLMRGDSQLRTKRSSWRRTMKYLPYRYLLPRLDAHLYVGQRNLEYLRHYGVPDERLFFAPHCVDNAFFISRAECARRDGTRLNLRRSLGIAPDDFLALFVGKLIEKKRAADFIAACGRVEATSPGRRLHGVLVGDGPLRGRLETLARPWAERIHFAGFHNQSELPAWYAAADALLLCSDASETWGLVVNEAMACGLPVVASEAAGCSPDLIEPGRTGYTYPLGDVQAIAARLCDMDRAARRDPAELQRSLAEKMAKYDFDRAAQGLEAAVTAVAARKGGSS